MNQDARNAFASVKRLIPIAMVMSVLILVYLGSYVAVRVVYQRELPRKPMTSNPPGPFLGTVITGENRLLQRAIYVVYFPLGRLEWHVRERPYFLYESQVSD